MYVAIHEDANSGSHIVFVLPAYTCQVPICAVLLLSDWNCRHSFTEPVCMDILDVHVLKMKGTFQLCIKSHPMIHYVYM
jgi:hypothetical protein